MVLCEILNEIIYGNRHNDFLASVRGSLGFENHKENMTTLLRELKRHNSPAEILNYKPSDIMYSDEMKLKILQFMYELSRNDTKTIFKEKSLEGENYSLDFESGVYDPRRANPGRNGPNANLPRAENLYRSQSPNHGDTHSLEFSDEKHPMTTSSGLAQNFEAGNDKRQGSSSLKPIKPKRSWGRGGTNPSTQTNVYSPRAIPDKDLNDFQAEEPNRDGMTLDNKDFDARPNRINSTSTSANKNPNKRAPKPPKGGSSTKKNPIGQSQTSKKRFTNSGQNSLVPIGDQPCDKQISPDRVFPESDS